MKNLIIVILVICLAVCVLTGVPQKVVDWVDENIKNPAPTPTPTVTVSPTTSTTQGADDVEIDEDNIPEPPKPIQRSTATASIDDTIVYEVGDTVYVNYDNVDVVVSDDTVYDIELWAEKDGVMQKLTTYTVRGSNSAVVPFIIDSDDIGAFWFVDPYGMTDSVNFIVGEEIEPYVEETEDPNCANPDAEVATSDDNQGIMI